MMKPDVVTFGTLIKGFCMTGNNSAAIQLLRRMEEGACKPDLVVYSTIIDSLCKDTLVIDALNLFLEMRSKGIAQMSSPLHP
ncbi:pentatricopeptide repeat-containing protein [Prunus yedoensis var. nudiflora]|uniref:Pentatricopeptide repeat-containing protein n=1 Tax=Prunus yedoensis var. nudiflora TaxID=2094558 RepID=A0A314Y803_PRUYE|nr:pentatricopeptide repeat-containing protein [Prunus yedoensis var. nudiflora]